MAINLLKKNILENWQQIDAVTVEFFRNIPENTYYQKPFSPRFKSFAWEFACILTTREMYLNGMKYGKLNAQTPSMTQEKAETLSKKEMVKKLKELESEITKIIKSKEQQKILFFGTNTDKQVLLSWLCQHEQLHFGKLMLYCAQAGIAQPKSLLRMWGEGSFPLDKKRYELTP